MFLFARHRLIFNFLRFTLLAPTRVHDRESRFPEQMPTLTVRVIAVIQLINKQGVDADCGGLLAGSAGSTSCEAIAGAGFTEQDAAVIGTFLGLLGPHIFQSSIFQSKVNIKVFHNNSMDMNAMTCCRSNNRGVARG